MNADFDILLNGAPIPSVVQMKGDSSTVAKLSIVARDGAASKGSPWSIDTEGVLLPIDNVRGQLDATGKASLVVGPSAMLGSVLKGNFTFNVKVGNKNHNVNVQIY